MGRVQVGDSGVQGGLDEIIVVGVHHTHGHDRKYDAGLAQGAQDEPAGLGLGRGGGEGLPAAQRRGKRGERAQPGRAGQAVFQKRSSIDCFRAHFSSCENEIIP